MISPAQTGTTKILYCRLGRFCCAVSSCPEMDTEDGGVRTPPFLKQAGGTHRAERHSRHRRRNPSFILESAGDLISYRRLGQRCYGNAGCSLVPVTLAASRRAATPHDIIAQSTMWPLTRSPGETTSELRQPMNQRDVEQLQAAQLHESHRKKKKKDYSSGKSQRSKEGLLKW